MKILLIITIILAILAAYFVLNTEKSFSIKGDGGVIPAGVDIPRFILNKVKNIIPISNNTVGSIIEKIKNPKEDNILESNIVNIAKEIKSKIGETKNKILEGSINLIRDPIKNKISDTFCTKN